MLKLRFQFYKQMLHAVIIDDEENGVRSLELLIKKYVPEVKVVASTNKPSVGIDIIDQYRPDLVFLDISMPVMNGFELLEKLTFRNFDLIFTTAHREFGLKALKKNAKDYLLKPVDADELKATVARLIQKRKENINSIEIAKQLLESNPPPIQRVPLNLKQSIEFVEPNEILCIEANSNRSRVTFVNMQAVDSTKPLKDYESLLCKNAMSFMRINYSCIINLNYIQKYLREEGGYVVLKGAKKFPISKHKINQFLTFINL